MVMQLCVAESEEKLRGRERLKEEKREGVGRKGVWGGGREMGGLTRKEGRLLLALVLYSPCHTCAHSPFP